MTQRFGPASLLAVLGAAAALTSSAPDGARAADEQQLERGRYLVQRVGTCADCHGPGLRGADLEFLAPNLPPAVARHAPAIAGLPTLGTAQAIRFFETGRLPNGKQARPPMPAIRLHRDDAEAIVAYLKTLR